MKYHFTLNKVASALSASEHEPNCSKAFLQVHEAIDVYAVTGVMPKQMQSLKAKHNDLLNRLGGAAFFPKLVEAFEQGEIEKKERSGWQKLIGSGTVVEASCQAEKLWSGEHYQDAIYLLFRSILQHREVKFGGGSSRLSGLLTEYSFQYAERLFKEHDAMLAHVTTTSRIRREQLQDIEEGLVMAYKLNPSSSEIKRRLKNFLELWEVYDDYEEACKQLEMRNLSAAKCCLTRLPGQYEFVREQLEECKLLESEVNDLLHQGAAMLAAHQFNDVADIIRLIQSKDACCERLPEFEQLFTCLAKADCCYRTAKDLFEQGDFDAASHEMVMAIELDQNDNAYRDFYNKLLNQRACLIYDDAVIKAESADLEGTMAAYQKAVDILPHFRDAADRLNKLSDIRAGLEKAMIEARELFSDGSLEAGLNLLKQAQKQGFTLTFVDELMQEHSKRLVQSQQAENSAAEHHRHGNFDAAVAAYKQAYALYSAKPGLRESLLFCESELHIHALNEQVIALQHSGQLEQLFVVLVDQDNLFPKAEGFKISAAYEQINGQKFREDIVCESRFYDQLQQLFVHVKAELQSYAVGFQQALQLYQQQQDLDRYADEHAVAAYQSILSLLHETVAAHYPDSIELAAFQSHVKQCLNAEEAYQSVMPLLGSDMLVHQVLPELLENVGLLTNSFPANEKYIRLMQQVEQVFPLFAEMKLCIVAIRDYHFKQASHQLRLFKMHNPDAVAEFTMMEDELQRFLTTDLRARIEVSEESKSPTLLIADLQLAQNHMHLFPAEFQTAMAQLEQRQQQAVDLHQQALSAMKDGDLVQCEVLNRASLDINEALQGALSLQQKMPDLKQGESCFLAAKQLLLQHQFAEAMDQFDKANILNDSLVDIEVYYSRAEEGIQTEKIESMINAAKNMFAREHFERAQQYAEEALSLLPRSSFPDNKKLAVQQLLAKISQQFSIKGNLLLQASNGRGWKVMLNQQLSLGRQGPVYADIAIGLQTISTAGKQTALLHENRAVYVLDQGSANGSLLKNSAARCPQGQKVLLNEQDSLIVGQVAELKLSHLKGDDAWLLNLLNPDHLDTEQLKAYWPSLQKDMCCAYLLMGRECYFGMNDQDELMPVGINDDCDLLLKIQYSEQNGYRVKLLEGDEHAGEWQPLRDGDILMMRDIQLFVEQL